MLELSLATGQATADFAQAVVAAELTGEHGDELSPTRETLDGIIGVMPPNRLLEFHSGEWL